MTVIYLEEVDGFPEMKNWKVGIGTLERDSTGRLNIRVADKTYMSAYRWPCRGWLPLPFLKAGK